jgi:divalent metal cation (Fe/Co/Zn/Cd) transporter
MSATALRPPEAPEHAARRPEQRWTGGPSAEELRRGFAKMRRLEWLTLAAQGAAAVLAFSVAGNSQVMKTEWLENLLAVVPAAGALLTAGADDRKQDEGRPFGYARAGTIAFVFAAFALTAIGVVLCYESAANLLRREHPSIGGITLFGQTVWRGWIMMAVMILIAIPPVLLARAKKPIARLLHDKPLHEDAEMNRANWLTNGTGVIGLLLVAGGFWWGDSAAALVISLDILRDGFQGVKRSLSDVMDQHPSDIESNEPDPIIGRVREALRRLPFVAEQHVQLREHGRFIFAEIFVRPTGDAPDAVEATRLVREAVMPLDWRLQHAVVELTADVRAAARVPTRRELGLAPD